MNDEEAIVHRKKGKPLTFLWHSAGVFVHESSRGSVYAIYCGLRFGKPFWIGRLLKDTEGNESWCTWEAQMGATKIEFENGSVYHFPKRDMRKKGKKG